MRIGRCSRTGGIRTSGWTDGSETDAPPSKVVWLSCRPRRRSPDVERRVIGTSDLEVAELGLGTMTFGREADEASSRAMVRAYLDAGGNFIDTADVYGGRGGSEEIVGRAIAGCRDDLIISTKGRMGMSDAPEDRGASRSYLVRAVDASLRRLDIDCIDLYQVHWPDPSVDAQETFAALGDLVRAGKLRNYGVSNYLGSTLQRAIDVCEFRGLPPLVVHQAQYSLVHREIELETLPLCAANGLGVVPWGPLGGGVVTGKYRPDEAPPADTRLGGPQTLAKLTERSSAIAAEVSAVAREIGRTPAQVALNWVLNRPGVTAPLVGARTVDQLIENLGASGWKLDPDLERRLDHVSAQPLPYPQATYQLLGIARYEPAPPGD
jgi:aryl-alcohol dehydrogenase-like predicted oxidoreductase